MSYRLLVGAALCLLSVLPVVSQAQTVTFVDDQGAPSATLVDGSAVRVRVADPSANAGPGRDSVSATVTSDLAGDSESLSLLETGPGTGVFEGLIDLEPGGSLALSTLATATSPGPPPVRDTVHAAYGSATASAGLVGSVIQFIDEWGRASASFVAGHRVDLRVRDELRNNPQSRDLLTVPVTSQTGGDSHPVGLLETGMNTGVFEVVFVTSRLPGDPSYLDVGVPDTITATLPAGDGVGVASAQAQIAGAAVVLRDEEGNPADTFVESALVRIRVIDPASPGSVSVQVTSTLTGDSETVVLAGGSIYDGEIQTEIVLGTPPPTAPGDGVLQIAEVWGPPMLLDEVTVTYTGAGSPLSASAGFIPGRLAFLDSRGEATSSYAAGTEARIRLEHPNSDTMFLDQTMVRLVNTATGEEEYVQLHETRHDSGVFIGSKPLTVNGSSQWHNGVMNAQPGEQIQAQHGDVVPQTADITDLSLEFLDEWGEPTDEIVESGPARVRMWSTFSNSSPSSADSASVEMRVRLSNDLETLTLSETGPDTNVFEGSISLEMGSFGNPDGTLQTSNSYWPDYRPDEVMARSGPVEAAARTVGARIIFLDAFGRRTESYTAGDTVRLRIVDHFRSAYGTSFQVSLVSLLTGDTEPVTMQETAPGTGIFEGSIPTTVNGTYGDGKLHVGVDLVHQIEVRHATGFSPIELIERASVTGSSILFVDAAGQPATTYLESTRAYVRVVSAYTNSSPSTQETLIVDLLAELSQDRETLTLTETGPDTGVFQGSIQLQLILSGSPSLGNGILETTETGYIGYHAFDTLRATFSGAPGEPAVARIDLTGSRTWLGNAAGDEVLAFPVGGTAYVWVEDQVRNTPGQWDQVQAEVRSFSSPSSTNPDEIEMVTLQETTRDSGIFRVAVPLPAGSSSYGDGQVGVQPGGQIEGRHQDSFGATWSTAVADITDGSIEFVDAAGEPTEELLESGEARVRLFSASANGNPGTADTAYVALRTLRSEDEEMVTLAETGPDTSVFEGSLPMARGPQILGNDVVETATSGSPEYRQDEVTARYGPSVSATARVVGARMVFFDRYGRETASFVAGEPVRVRVVDRNRDDPQSRDTVNIYLSSRDGADSESLTLQETGFDTSIFEGSIASTFGGSSGSSDGQLRVFPEDRIEAQHYLASEPTPLRAYADVTGSSVVFIDAAGQPATVYLESSRARVRVVSTAANANPSSTDTISVEVRSELSPDIETVSLTETGTNTGVFEGGIQMRLSTGGVQQGNGLLETTEWGHPQYQPPHEFDTLLATFSDPTGTSVAHIGLTGSRTWFADASGTEVLSYPVGGTAYVRVEDQSFNNLGQWDQIGVQVRSLTTGDEESLSLLETTRDSGIFVKAIELTVDAVSSDGKLSVSPGGQIEASHTDYMLNTASSAVADIADASIVFLNDAGEPTAELLESGTMRVRLFSLSGNGSPGTADTAYVALRTLRSEDEEMVTLAETGPDTSVFEGSLPMARGPRILGNELIETTTSGFPEYLQDEVTVRFGPSVSATARVVGARMVFLDRYGRETASVVAGEPVRVRVVDYNRDDSQNRETVNITLSSRDGADSESLSLQETGFDTSIFEGSIPSTFGGSSGPSDSQLRVFPGDRIEAQHYLAAEPNPLRAYADVTGSSVVFIDAAGQPATVYLESSRARVRVVSTAANANPSSTDTISVEVRSELSPDIETVSLTETGLNTGVFEGGIQMRLSSGGAQQGNGLLETAEWGHPQYQPPHEFDTLRATFSDPTGTSEAHIGLTGSRTWFADASGAEVLSYPVGGTAYVRVEDQNFNNPGQWDQIGAQVRSLTTGDEEFLSLLETTRDSGIFVKAIALTVDAVSSDGKLSVSPGGQIEAHHGDYALNTSSSAVADIADASVVFLNDAGEPTSELLESGRARVRLFSVSTNGSPGTADTAYVALRTLRSEDEEMVTLAETGPDTSVFEGSLPMARGPRSLGNELVETTTSGFPEYLQDEVTARFGPSVSATARVVGARMMFLDRYGRETASVVAGEPVRVRVVDYNRDDSQNRETVNITLYSRDGADSESLNLQETGFDTSILEGSIPSTFGGSSGPSDSQLRVFPGDRIEAQHYLASEPSPLRAYADVTGSSVLFIDAAGQPAPVYLESSRAYVRVVSTAANTSPSSADTISVEVRSELSPDIETVSLTETGPNTGVFEGGIQMRLSTGGVQQGNGLLETTEWGHPQYQPPHEFDTLLATFSDATGTSVAHIGLTGSRTWFADASGAEVLSYPVGGTAYVRVEDQNFNTPGQWDQIGVQVRSLTTGDEEFLSLLETTRDSGIFVKAIELTVDAVSSDGKLSVSPGGQIEAHHGDYALNTSSSAVADIADASVVFLNDAGEPAAELLESGTARVRLFSVSSNGSPGTADTAYVALRTLRSEDEEMVTLAETGPDTSVFEGSLPMARGPRNLGNELVETTTSGFPEYLQDEVTVRWGPSVSATARVVGARMVFLDGYGRETASVVAGESVRVQVVDYNRDDSQNRETVYITLSSRDGADSESLTLQETGFDTSIFEGSIPSTFGGSSGPSDGQLRVFPGDRVEAQHYLAAEPNPLRAYADVTGSSVVFIDAAGQPATVYLESSRAYVRVVSTAANASPSSADTIPVEVRSELSPDIETVSLTETGASTGVFEGGIKMRLATDGVVQQGNGILETVEMGSPMYQPPHEVDTLRATFSDPTGTSVAHIGLTGSRTWFADASGTEVLSYPVGGTAYVRVEDQNFNNPGQWDQIGVRVLSLTTGDEEHLSLQETTRDSGIFVQAIALTTDAVSSDGKLSVSPGGQIEARHGDYMLNTSSSAVADIADASIEFLDDAGEPTAELLEGGTARMRLFSVSTNGSPGTADTAYVALRTLRSEDEEVVTLTETGPDTSVFEGSLPMARGPRSLGNGLVETTTSGFPEYRQDEVTARFGPSVSATARVVGARMVFLDGYGRETANVVAGEPVRVRVVDYNRNDSQNRETVNITLSSRDGVDSESLTLQETGFATSVFEGSIPSTFGGSSGPSDGQLRVFPGDRIEAQHYLAAEPNPLRAYADVTGSSVVFIDAAGQPATVYLESSRAYVRVVSTAANTSPSSADTISVEVRSELSPDIETVSLTETGASTGVFEGGIQMRLATDGVVQQGNGILETVEMGSPIYQPPHEVDTLRATFSDPTGTSVAHIGLTGSRTWFADASGTEVLSYPVGGTAYVRVEDQNFNDPGQLDQIEAPVRSLTTGDEEYVTLQETAPDSGIFVQAIELTMGAVASDGKLSVSPGDQIEASHADYMLNTFSSAVADITDGAIDFLDDAGQVTVELLEGGEARVRLFSVSTNGNPGAADTAYVALRTLRSEDEEGMELTETGPDTGVFVGSLPMATGPRILGNGVIETISSGFPAYLPDEVTARYGPSVSATAVLLPARVVFLNLRGQEVSHYARLSAVRVRVTDHTRNTDPGQSETVDVSVGSLVSNDVETITLTETGPDAGVFEGSIPSTDESSLSGDAILTAPPGQVEVSHYPASSPNPILRQATIRSTHRPDANPDTATTLEDEVVVIPVLANDLGGSALTLGAVTQPAHGTAAMNPDGTVTYTPAAGYFGPDAFTYVVVDTEGGENVGSVTVTVTPGNQAPTPNPDNVTTPEDQPLTVNVLANDTDPDQDPLDVVAVAQPAAGGGTAVLNADDTVTYTPPADANPVAYINYTVSDPDGAQATTTLRVEVTAVNDPPVANDDTATTGEDTVVVIEVTANDSDIDSATYAPASVTTPANGTAEIVLSNVVYTPDPEFSGTDTFSYTLQDDAGATDTATVTITVTDVNDPPVANDDDAGADEDFPVAIQVLANDSDPENDTLEVTAVTQGAHGSVTINPNGTVTYAPDADSTAVDSFTYTISDGQGGTDTATVTMTITPSNDAPEAFDDAATVAEDGEIDIDVLANDTDPESSTLEVDSVTQGDHGTVAINPDQTVRYTPAANFHGTDTFTYTASDGGNGGTDTAVVTVTVTPVNDAPAANADTALVAEDGTVAVPVLANDDDADGDTLTVTAVTQGADGSVVINPDQTVRYTPSANFYGTDTFTYTVGDGHGGTASATVTVTVESDNDAPVAVADSATTAEDTAVTVTVLANDSDPDLDELDVVSVTQGTNGTVTLNANETVTYTPALNFHGTDTFTYTVGDGNGGSHTATVTITVAPVNDAPVANADTALAAEDGTVDVPVLANDEDADNDTLTVTSVTQGAHGAVVINPDQTVTYTPTANYNGTDAFTYTVSDGNGGTATATVTVTVGSDNDAPVAGADSATTAEDTAVTVTVLANDSDLDNDALQVDSTTQGDHGTVVINPDRTVTYTPALNFHGTDTFTYTAGDGNGGTATATVTITITSVNDAPIASGDAALVTEDGTVSVPVLANDEDADNDTLTVASVTQGAHGSVAINPNQTVRYTPAANYNGTDSFTCTIDDGNGGTATATVTVTIGSDNDAPVAGADSATTAEDTAVSLTVLANDSDLDNDVLDVLSVTQGTNGTVALNANETVTYTPALNFHGTDTFTYTVGDGNGGSATATVTVTVTPVNDAPVANADSASVAEDGAATITVLGNDSDADNDTLNVASVTQGAHGSVAINPDKTLTYTPAANYNGGDAFTYTINDGNGGTATATVTVTVNSVNDAPTANPDAATVVEDGSVAVTVLANDSDPENNTLNVASVTQGAHGSVAINPNKTITYLPAANYNGGDSFTYTINDGNGGTATATVTVTVTAVNDAPVAVNDTATTLAETLVDIPVLSNDVDVDGPSLSIQSVTQPAHGTVSINANQTVRYTPASGYKGADSFTYIARDGVGGTATATVSLTVNAPPRVTTNLQVLYGFNEGSGTAVTDTSGVGTPLNLTIGSASAVSWISGGLQVNSATLIESAGAATKVITASQSTNAITLEAWINPLNTSQTGPIATVSQQSNKLNVALNQSGNRWNGKLRTTSTNQAGTALNSAAGTATLNLTHVVYTRDASGNVRIYVNGVQSASTTLAGNFSSWTSSYKLGLVNELGSGSPWRGKLFLVAIYNRALSSTEARQNWLAGE